MSNPKPLTPEEYEKKALSHEGSDHPMNAHAFYFHVYSERMKQELRDLSKKELLVILKMLAQSKYSQKEHITKLLKLGDGLNLNSISRTINNVVQSPLNDEPVTTQSNKEMDFFVVMSDLFMLKYRKSLDDFDNTKTAYTNDDIVEHLHTEKEFKKLNDKQQSLFNVINQVLFSKTVMMKYTEEEFLKKLAEEKEKENGNKE